MLLQRAVLPSPIAHGAAVASLEERGLGIPNSYRSIYPLSAEYGIMTAFFGGIVALRVENEAD